MSDESPIIQVLQRHLERGKLLLDRTEPLNPGNVAMWTGGLRAQLSKIYGSASPALNEFPAGINRDVAAARGELAARMGHLTRILEALNALLSSTKSPLLGKRIFIGHGRSLVWLQLKDFIRESFGLPCDEFNIEPAAGLSTTARLEAMLSEAGFAFVVMTAEEKHADGTFYARPNVIHESGLFQGKLGTRKAIILLEDGCSDFSNIAGLTQIRFHKDDMRAAFEQIRGVLKREGLIQ